MSYQLLTKTTNSVSQNLLTELHELEANSALIFCSKIEPYFDLLARNREYFIQVKRVYLLRVFDLPAHQSAYNTENIFIDNTYNYDPNNKAFKFGMWFHNLKQKLIPEKDYVIRLIGTTDRPNWQSDPV